MPLALPAELPLEVIAAESVLHRAHRTRREPIHFGPPEGEPPTNRFDAPDGSYRTCYLGTGVEAAFVEGVLHGPVPTQLVSARALRERAIAEIRVREPLSVVSFYGPFLLRVGATAAVTHGDDYAVSRPWGKAFHDHGAAPDGILYTSRHDEHTYSLALFDRARHKIEAGRSQPLLESEPSTLRLLLRYGLGLT